MRRLTPLIVLAAFIFSCGGEWYVLQGIAWMKMIHDYSQMVPFTEAVSMTFSGKFPCPICKAIAEKKQQENDKLASLDKQAKKFLSSHDFTLSIPQAKPVSYSVRSCSLESRKEQPPSPPPRFLLA